VHIKYIKKRNNFVNQNFIKFQKYLKNPNNSELPPNNIKSFQETTKWLNDNLNINLQQDEILNKLSLLNEKNPQLNRKNSESDNYKPPQFD
jgi:hypothetical protein